MIELFTNKIAVLDIVEGTVVDGPGMRTSIYCAGCKHACPGCHNQQSWAFDGGKWMSVDELFEAIQQAEFDDVTFSGGDPMYQAPAFTALAKRIKQETNKTIWCYTGFSFEELMEDDARRELLNYIDVVVDGPFVEALKDEELRFRGSSNQRVVAVRSSLAEKKVCLYSFV